MHSPLQRVLRIFELDLGHRHATRLVGGFHEPEYLPPYRGRPAEIRFRLDYPASALHEVAHWCIAGERRRRLHDFGYWYQPEGRDAAAQLAFEQAEVKPQALEWIFSRASGQPFFLSRDNVGLGMPESGFNFSGAVSAQAQCYCAQGALPSRAAQFAEALAAEFGQPCYKNPEFYTESRL